MQTVTDAERVMLTSPGVTITSGLDLLDTSNAFVEDISDDLIGGDVSRSNYATVHGTCSLALTRELAWGRDRVRPWMEVTDGLTTARWNLGVFVLTTPDNGRGEDPPTWEVQGYDLLHLLQDGPGDTYVVTAGTTYLQAVRDVVTASGVGATLRLDGTGQDTALPADMVWCLTEEGVSWLRIINDMLEAIGYRALWVNAEGELRSAPYVSPSSRPVEWVFDTSDESTNIVGEDRTETADVWGAPNHWRFVRKNMTAQPAEGAGIYTVENVSDGPTSQNSLGRVVRKVTFLEAANQTSLAAQGDRIVATDLAVSRRFDIDVDPLPIAGHFDVVQLVDGGESVKCQVVSWSLPLDGSPGAWLLEAVNG
jgi:hypothetical protein